MSQADRPGPTAATCPVCPTCGGVLLRVKRPSDSPYNSDQFDSQRAGDYYCEKCPDNGRGNSGLHYWWHSEVAPPPSNPPRATIPAGYCEDKDVLLGPGSFYNPPEPSDPLAGKSARENEADAAVRIANRILDIPGKDPDDDESVLARQFLRLAERRLAATANRGVPGEKALAQEKK